MNQKLDMSVLDKITIPEVDSLESFEEKTVETSNTNLQEPLLEEVDSLEDFDDTITETSLTEEVSTENTESNDSDSLREIAKWAHDLGILDYEEDKFESSEEYFKEKFFEKVKKEALESLPSEIKYLAEGYLNGISLNELINSKAREESFASLTEESLEDERLQESLVSQWLALQDHDSDEIKDKIESYKDGLLLEKEAKVALKKLKKYETSYQEQLANQAAQQKEQAQLQYTKQLEDLKKNIDTVDTFIPGIQLQKQDKEKLYMAITRRDRNGKTELENKMSSKEMQLAVAQFVLQLEGNLETIERKAYTKAAQKTKAVVNTYSDDSKNKKIDMSIVRKAIDQSKKNYKF